MNDPKSARFLELLARLGWSQAQAARELRITPGAVSQICTGKTRPHPATLNSLEIIAARKTGRQPVSARKSSPDGLQPHELEMVLELRKLPESQRAWAASVARQTIRAFAVVVGRKSAKTRA